MLYVTAKDSGEAKFLARELVKDKYAACANIFPISSFYWWNDEINEDNEYALIFKTDKNHVESAINKIKQIHSYDVPCIVTYEIAKGNIDYLQWISDSVN